MERYNHEQMGPAARRQAEIKSNLPVVNPASSGPRRGGVGVLVDHLIEFTARSRKLVLYTTVLFLVSNYFISLSSNNVVSAIRENIARALVNSQPTSALK